MSVLFNISYALVWTIVVFHSYFLLEKMIASRKMMQEMRAMRSEHGVEKDKLFPQLEFKTIHHGIVNISKTNKRGSLIAFTSTGCDQCKLLYPIKTGYFPFVYYLNERGEVETKGVINVREQLEHLVKNSRSA
ncbi:hypothetical protein I6N90_00530 [Paenibacillus sp. GSMTC-2017]|uniref:hypothetical protein n=1 Tax=Paenibacillus sp. GSMTC-2017 TaxID=2794350 RepID=UPI0018D5AD8F|nr:hypothetical protein [Paenibacillus sp. GSMTC-2017]MBH5316292.1 hypothetical protein [Paenibacillus sp. GSMTC-2017]